MEKIARGGKKREDEVKRWWDAASIARQGKKRSSSSKFEDVEEERDEFFIFARVFKFSKEGGVDMEEPIYLAPPR